MAPLCCNQVKKWEVYFFAQLLYPSTFLIFFWINTSLGARFLRLDTCLENRFPRWLFSIGTFWSFYSGPRYFFANMRNYLFGNHIVKRFRKMPIREALEYVSFRLSRKKLVTPWLVGPSISIQKWYPSCRTLLHWMTVSSPFFLVYLLCFITRSICL